MDKDTEEFLRILNRQNTAIAAREAEKAAKVPPDLIRLQREAERREKWGTLRAREKSGNRSRRVRSIYGPTDLLE